MLHNQSPKLVKAISFGIILGLIVYTVLLLFVAARLKQSGNEIGTVKLGLLHLMEVSKTPQNDGFQAGFTVLWGSYVYFAAWIIGAAIWALRPSNFLKNQSK